MENIPRAIALATLSRRQVMGLAPAVLCQACRRGHKSDAPVIEFTRIPQADPAGTGTQ